MNELTMGYSKDKPKQDGIYAVTISAVVNLRCVDGVFQMSLLNGEISLSGDNVLGWLGPLPLTVKEEKAEK